MQVMASTWNTSMQWGRCVQWSRAGAGFLLLLAACSAWAEMEVIALRHRTVDQVLPILRPLLESGGALSGMNDQLVIRASRANIAELRRVLNAIDVEPRRLMISVRQDSGGGSGERGTEVRATVGGARVVISNQPGASPSPERGVPARIHDSRSANETRLEHRIQALEGTPALIQIGQLVPISNRTVTQGAGGAMVTVVTDSVAYREVTTGFEVVPRVAGDRVILDISPRRDTYAPGAGSGGAINVQRIASTASGRLGEWFELGAASEDESRQASGLLAGTSALRQDVRRVWVKVEEIK